MRHRTKIDDIARLAGVSTATVSRTLNLPDMVSEKTRRRVLRAIDETGYTQHASAQDLRRQRSNAVLVLVPDIGNTFFSEILAGIEQVASANAMTILIGHTANGEQRERKFLTYLLSGRADGVLLLNGHLPAQSVQSYGKRFSGPMPVVSISEALQGRGIRHVGIDNVAAAAAATRHLIALGHRRIVHVKGPAQNVLTRQRAAGFEQAITAAGLGGRGPIFLQGDFAASSGERAARSVLAMQRRPTAVFCANDEMAMGMISVLHANGVGVPRDISVVGFDDISFARTFIPALTTIRQPRTEFGIRAMQLLVGLLANPDKRPKSVDRLETELIVRQSTARVAP